MASAGEAEAVQVALGVQCGHAAGAGAGDGLTVDVIGHITGGHIDAGKGSFQPMNINYGLLPPLEAPKVDEDGKRIHPKERGRAKKRLQSIRAMAARFLALLLG